MIVGMAYIIEFIVMILDISISQLIFLEILGGLYILMLLIPIIVSKYVGLTNHISG